MEEFGFILAFTSGFVHDTYLLKLWCAFKDLKKFIKKIHLVNVLVEMQRFSFFHSNKDTYAEHID